MDHSLRSANPSVLMKIIFLDIDGPLLSHRAKFLPQNAAEWCKVNVPPLPEAFDRPVGPIKDGADRVRHFDPVATELLRRLVTGHSARIVISSSWQKSGDVTWSSFWKRMEFLGTGCTKPGERIARRRVHVRARGISLACQRRE